MISILKKYNKYIVYIILLFLVLNLLKSILNIYSFLLIIISLILAYRINKKLFKKIIYKTLYNRKILKINNKLSAAKKSLKSISELKKLINDNINLEMINYEKYKIEKQLNNSDYNVILFGAGSCGKTSIARSLLKNMVGEISASFGTTKKLNNYKIRIPFLKRDINIIDTPGIFEASEEGKIKEKETIKKAAESDLIIFVIDQDLNKYELYLLRELSKIGKSIIIALNKCDLRSTTQNESIKENIYKLIEEFSENHKVICTIAAPQSIANIGGMPKKQIVKVENLFNEIINTLDENGEELLADNILLQCNKLGLISKNLINVQRKNLSKKIINKYSWITSGVVLLTPIPAIDLIATTTINFQMIIEISKIYDVTLSKNQATELTKSIIAVIASLGIVKGGMNVITNLLSNNFTTSFITKSIQSITAAWIIRIVGYSFINYFQKNQDWGDGGIQEVVQEVYELNKREEILKIFLKEAINNVKFYRKKSSRKKLPPHSQKG